MPNSRNSPAILLELAALQQGSAGRIPSQNPKEIAYKRLKEDIVFGRLPFGAVLSPRKLGREMGMSFLPVADALRVLETEGLVETKDRVGSRVKVPTVEDIKGVYTVREALESQAARICCERATNEQRRLLMIKARHVDEMYDHCAHEDSDMTSWLETSVCHANFHHFIAECAAVPRLTRAIDDSQVLTFKILFDAALRRKKRPKNWHQVLVQAIVEGSPVEADRAAREHISYGTGDVLQYLSSLQTQDRWRA